MATYKVIQDIEAEDKLVGPLTFRQFVYAGIAALNFYLAFLIASKGAPLVALVFVPIGGVCAFFAWPFASNQPTEVWALAKIRFLLLPRRRIWDQSGVKEMVTITVPKKIERQLTNGLSQTEVRSRLHVLADTIDSRGWAIKNVNVSMYGQPALVTNDTDSDRLVSINSLPQPVTSVEVTDSDDMLDEQHSPVARQFDTMIAASTKAHRQDIMSKMQAANTPAATPPPSNAPPAPPTNDYWFLNQPSGVAPTVPQDAVTFNTQVVTPGTPRSSLPVASANPTADEELFIKSHKNEPAFSPNMHGHLHVIQPLSATSASAPPQSTIPIPATNALQPNPPATTVAQASQPNNAAASTTTEPVKPVTRNSDTAILDLARNDDLNVATIAREAQKRKEPPADEVVISLR